MTDRRRNTLVLLLVAGLLLGSFVAIVAKKTRLGLDLKGGTSLVYQAKPTRQSQVTGDAISRSIDIMRKRVDTLGVAEPEIQRTGSDQIDVSLPDVQNAGEAARIVGKTAQMYFYDWEANVIGPNGKPDPTNQAVTGGQIAGQPSSSALTQYQAVLRAAKRPAQSNPNETATGPTYYMVDTQAKKVLAGPAASLGDLRAAVRQRKVLP
jgi:SecD/SecF fusion protein